MDKIHRSTFRVHTYETDFEGQAHVLSLVNYLQDAAGVHAAERQFSVTDLFKRGLTWVLSRYHVRVHAYPVMGDRLTIETWGSGRRGLFALRDFRMRNDGGTVLLTATSSWMVLDLRTHQPVRIDEFLPADYVHEERALDDDFKSLPVVTSASRELPFRVEMRDVDLNRHVNNAVYIRWALEAAPPEVLSSRRPSSIEVSYRAEAFYGDEVVSRVEPAAVEGAAAASFHHQIVNRATGVELTRLRTSW